MNKTVFALTGLVICLFLGHCVSSVEDKTVPMTAAGKPAEGEHEVFLGEPFFQKEILFNGDRARGPNITVAVDGTVLAKGQGQLRLSEDGGKSWGEPQEAPFPTLVVNENNGDVIGMLLARGDDPWDDRIWRSSDHGKTWKEEKIILKPNEVMKWHEQTGFRVRQTYETIFNVIKDTRWSVDHDEHIAKYYIHVGAAESGITLRHGERKGRLLMTATFRPVSSVHPSDRAPVDAIYSTAIYSDDGGSTWQVSGLFPEGYTEEAALAELHDGRIYYNSRSHSGYYDKSLARELRHDENLRREAWSYDGGQTWEDLRVIKILPDGGGVNRGYGMMGGLVRLPVKDRDILIYSNSDTGGGAREKMTVWASFDGGETWPLKRLVYEPHGAYSSLDAGRPGTSSEGMIYLLFEGGTDRRYSAIQVASFNLAWLLQGELTGDGMIPDWAK